MTHDRDQTNASATSSSSHADANAEPGRASAAALLRKPEQSVPSGLLQRRARDSNGVADGADSAVAAAASSTGSALPETLQRKFESSLGADLSGVRVHTGGESAAANDAVGAKAYTTGNDIHFGAGNYDPSSKGGEHLLAHEVAHTVQQGGAQRMQFKLEVSSPLDAHEHEADRAADAMVTGAHANVSGGPSIASREAKAVAAEAEWDAAKADVAKAQLLATLTAIHKTKQKLYRVKQGSARAKLAKAEAETIKTTAEAAHRTFSGILEAANAKAKDDNLILDYIRDKVVGAVVDYMMGPAKVLTELPVIGGKLYSAAKHFVTTIVDQEYLAIIPDEPLFDVPTAGGDAKDKYAAAMEMINAIKDRLLDATAGHEAIDPLLVSVSLMKAAVETPSTAQKLQNISKTAAQGPAMIASCKAADVDSDTAIHAAVELEHQARLGVTGEREMEKRLWSEWLRTNTPPEDHGMVGVAGHPNISIGAHLESLGLMKFKDGKRLQTDEVKLQRLVGAKVIGISGNPFTVKTSDGTSGALPALAPTKLCEEYIVVGVAGETHLQLAPAKAPVDLEAELDEALPGSIVTVVDHLMPIGTVMTARGIVPAASENGVGVASGSTVPVVKMKEGRLYVDASQAKPGMPFAQYGTPGVTQDTHFPVARAIPGRPAEGYGYFRDTFHLQASSGTKEYFVLDGYHLENNLDTVVCKKD